MSRMHPIIYITSLKTGLGVLLILVYSFIILPLQFDYDTFAEIQSIIHISRLLLIVCFIAGMIEGSIIAYRLHRRSDNDDLASAYYLAGTLMAGVGIFIATAFLSAFGSTVFTWQSFVIFFLPVVIAIIVSVFITHQYLKHYLSKRKAKSHYG